MFSDADMPRSFEQTFEEMYKRRQVADIVAKSLEEKQRSGASSVQTFNLVGTPEETAKGFPRSYLVTSLNSEEARSHRVSSQYLNINNGKNSSKRSKELTPPRERRGVLSKSKSKLQDSVKRNKSPVRNLINEDLKFDLGKVIGTPSDIPSKEDHPRPRIEAGHQRKTSYNNTFIDAADPDNCNLPIL